MGLPATLGSLETSVGLLRRLVRLKLPWSLQQHLVHLKLPCELAPVSAGIIKKYTLLKSRSEAASKSSKFQIIELIELRVSDIGAQAVVI